eukprot:7383359-Prymnesium_polylepis.2
MAAAVLAGQGGQEKTKAPSAIHVATVRAQNSERVLSQNLSPAFGRCKRGADFERGFGTRRRLTGRTRWGNPG